MLGFYTRNLAAILSWDFAEVKSSGEFGAFMVQVFMLGPAALAGVIGQYC